MNSSRHGVVGNNGNWHEFEAAQVQYIDGYYYMFVNLGECCAGNQSTYYIVVGRSTNPTGPYLDKNGRSLWDYGGSTILSTSGNYIGPGHFGYLNNNGPTPCFNSLLRRYNRNGLAGPSGFIANQYVEWLAQPHA
jgi:arabinan endo-1,5-alpha-L-arabinosidase